MIDPDKISGRLGNRMFQIAYLYAQMKDGLIPDIFVQDPKYFEKHSEEIKKLFGEGIGFLPFVGVHVRRTDYVNNDFYADLASTDYYEKAMAMFPDKKFLIFSDDTEFCKERFKGDNIQVMEGGTDLEDFNMLASCSDLIIANSSFSFWCAYLCPNPAKKIIAPKDWYTDGNGTRTIIPKTWIRI